MTVSTEQNKEHPYRGGLAKLVQVQLMEKAEQPELIVTYKKDLMQRIITVATKFEVYRWII